jgi:hypothetical protein
MVGEESLDRCNFPVRQQLDDPPTFEVADNGAVATIAPEGPVVDADDRQRIRGQLRSTSDNTQQRVIANRQHQPSGKAGCRATAQSQAKMIDQTFQPCCPTRTDRQDAFSEPFGENLLATIRGGAHEAPGRDAKQ